MKAAHEATQHLNQVFLDLVERKLVVIHGGSLSTNDFGLASGAVDGVG